MADDNQAIIVADHEAATRAFLADNRLDGLASTTEPGQWVSRVIRDHLSPLRQPH
jgi:hypothetical protein